MSWLIAGLGLCLLIVLHELGHFFVAKAVGMRVERFALFFPPLIWKKRRGETEYGVGVIPLGGYVRITGMNPNEDIPVDVAHRAYYRQAVWKRIAVIIAGPAVNIVLAFFLMFALFSIYGVERPTLRVGSIEKSSPATGVLRVNDRLISVDGVRGDLAALAKQIGTHSCPGRQTNGCVAETAATIVVDRGGRQQTLSVKPTYNAGLGRSRLGFSVLIERQPESPISAAGMSLSQMWKVTERSVSTIVRIVNPEVRKEVSGVVGSYEVTRQAVKLNLVSTLSIFALISLSLGIINLFPFLPFDGGHIFWALAEKIRGKPIPFVVMERAGLVGFGLMMILFFIGLSNDIGRLTGDGIKLQ